MIQFEDEKVNFNSFDFFSFICKKKTICEMYFQYYTICCVFTITT